MTDAFLRTLASSLPLIKYYLIGLVVFTVIESFWPAERGQSWADKRMSVAFSMVTCISIPFVIYIPTRYISEPLFHLLGHPLVTVNLDKVVGSGTAGWLARNLILPFAPILVLDFFYYWTHRFQHTIPALWEQHKLHHTEYSLCAATNFRHHWLEEGVRIFTLWIPMGVTIRVTGGDGTILAAVLAYWSFFIHANLKLPLGPLTGVFAGPQLHRIHHSALPEHFDRNFAAYFPVWDVIFGSYYRPAKDEWPTTGLSNGERARGFLHGLIMPFEAAYLKLRAAQNKVSSLS